MSAHSHYHKDVRHLDSIDVYRVLDLFKVTDPCVQHAVKKLLVMGGRGAGKDADKDLQEAIDSLLRAQAMRKEDQEPVQTTLIDTYRLMCPSGVRYTIEEKRHYNGSIDLTVTDEQAQSKCFISLHKGGVLMTLGTWVDADREYILEVTKRRSESRIPAIIRVMEGGIDGRSAN
ncbi:hypothetical protein [Stenotrophomonas phage BUCT627]|uniref:Uncharacterized protein n=2 Tax=Bixiavirus TaxID=3044676 RepID=A0AC61NA12_9CAUD|nr:hypothetical protein PQD76_gp14 [Stenotrophomonas phage BUCT626]YP_010677500.1 hypothetical protein PQD77_gp059 [Stenotrophomonas phage BUCT627]QYC96700.1 hypothetical protein [Stenotrophomonas phage BUCT627]QYC96718.1 hypothetical protein [Stenotrophomonas phage BUCT626]